MTERDDMAVIPTGAVHPVANLFPMLPDDELQELADDIRANGLQHPIVLDKDGVLIDGRNRWAA
jgi:ParB-like chromosome segregation protein Spo0J